MAQDLLQISLEHHRAGRMRPAEAGYRSLLESNPDHAEAAHWLGVLLHQAGQVEQAIPMLQKAVANRPTDPAFSHNLALALQTAGRSAEAIAELQRSVGLDPSAIHPRIALGRALLLRRNPADAVLAADHFAQALRSLATTADPKPAELHPAEIQAELGVALLAAGRAREAADALLESLRLKPDAAPVLYQLALAHRPLNQPKEVRKYLNKALEIDPAMASAWYALGALEAEAGNLSQSASFFRRAVRARADYAAAWQSLARVLRADNRFAEADQADEMAERGRRGELFRPAEPSPAGSVEALEKKMTDPVMARLQYAMAATVGVGAPQQVPLDAVADLFDRYAPRFDTHLQEGLNYRGPRQMADALKVALAQKPAGVRADGLLDTLDLGCGTGLCGPVLRPLSATLVGVDLSAAMLDRARERNVYDRLEKADLVQVLAAHPRSFDLLNAADVLIYVGDLSPTFEQAARALRPNGLFLYSVEAGGGDRYRLDSNTRRFKHAKPYLQRLAAMYGLEEVAFNDIPLRSENGQVVPGFLVTLRLPDDRPS